MTNARNVATLLNADGTVKTTKYTAGGGAPPTRVEFTATAGQTTKTGLTYTVGNIDCYVNGSKMMLGTDFTAGDGVSVTFSVALTLGAEVQLIMGTSAAIASGVDGVDGVDGAGIISYANLAAFPATHTAASMGYATDTNSAYMSDGTNWRRMSIGTQIGPQYITVPPVVHKLDPTGVTTSISAVAVDESGFPVTYDWDALSGNTLYSASSLPPQLTAVSESNGTFTLTPSTDAANVGTISFRIKASDGVLSTPVNCSVKLSFKEFYGMFFSAGSDGLNVLLGDAATPTLTSITNIVTSATAGTDGFVIRDANRDIFFYRYYNAYMHVHNVNGVEVSSFPFGPGSQACTDGTYAYGTWNGTIFRKHLTTLVSSNISASGFDNPTTDQGAWLVYHDGHLYSKSNANDTTISKYNLTDGILTTLTHPHYSTGGYCDGGCVVTNEAGVSFIVEVGTSYAYVLNLSTEEVVRIESGSGSSTEYGNGAGEIAPGIALVFGEQSDRATLVDTNTSPPTYTTYLSADNPYSVNHSFGNRFGFAAGIV